MSEQSLREKLDLFEQSKLSAILNLEDSKVQEYINWSEDKMKSASKDDLKGWIYSISRYLIHITDLQSFHYSRFIALQRILDLDVNSTLHPIPPQDKFLTFEERKMKSIGSVDSFREMYLKMTEHEMFSNRLNKVVYSLGDLIKRIEGYVNRN